MDTERGCGVRERGREGGTDTEKDLEEEDEDNIAVESQSLGCLHIHFEIVFFLYISISM